MRKYLLLIQFFLSLFVFGQKAKIDSLKFLLAKAKPDTGKVNVLNELSGYYPSTNPDTCLLYAQEAYQLSKKNGYALGKIHSRFNMAIMYSSNNQVPDALILLDSLKEKCEELKTRTTGEHYNCQKLLARIFIVIANCNNTVSNYDVAIENYKLSLKTSTSINHKKLMASAYLSLGWAYNRIGNYSESIKNNFSSLKISEELHDRSRIASIYNSIAAVYMAQKKWEEALIYLKKATVIAEKDGFYGQLVSVNYNIATIYITENKPQIALGYAQKSYKYSLNESPLNKHGYALALLVLADSYSGLNEHSLAIQKNTEALNNAESISDSNLIANCYVSMTHKYKCAGDMKMAISYGEKGLALCKRIAAQELTSIVTPFLIECYVKTGNYKKAYEMKLLEVATNDSILSESNEREILNQQYQYKYQKQAIADSLKYDNDKKIQTIETKANLKTQQNKQIVLSIGLLLALLSGAILFNRFKLIKKQKTFIEVQSKELSHAHIQLEEQSKEINDSIVYSKDIQNMFLKSITEYNAYFKDSILLYKPKATVSGDFYWYKEINNNLIIVVGDCTGHGVPGAIISVLAIQTLEKVIGQLTDYTILHELNSLMNDEFKVYNKKDSYVGIGLDFSVICVNKAEGKIYLSGSGGSITMKNAQQKLVTHKFESINIGGAMPVLYNPTTLMYDLRELSSVFLYTDGIVDQKGGIHGKKFGTKKLMDLLLNLNTNNANEALQIIENDLIAWQGKQPQIDDMTLLGIQFNV